MNAMPTPDKHDLHLLYQITVADLAYFKTQQWSVTYYALLIDTGLIGVAGLLAETLRVLDRGILSGLAVLAAIGAFIVLSKLEKSIRVRHSRLEAVRERLGPTFNRAWAAEDKGRERVHAIDLLRVGIVLTGILTVWLAWRI